MEQVENEIASVNAKIARVEEQIEAVENQLLAEGLSRDDLVYWRRKEEQLRKEEEQLRNEKEIRLKHELAQGRPPLDRRGDAVALHKKLDLLLEHALRRDRATPQYSPAFVGNSQKTRLLERIEKQRNIKHNDTAGPG